MLVANEFESRRKFHQIVYNLLVVMRNPSEILAK